MHSIDRAVNRNMQVAPYTLAAVVQENHFPIVLEDTHDNNINMPQ
jgi:hypothetical protein